MFGNSLTHRLETGAGVKQKNEDKNKSREYLFCEEEMIDFPVSSQKCLFVDVESKKQH